MSIVLEIVASMDNQNGYYSQCCLPY